MDQRINFVFLHVGEDTRPNLLVKSIRKYFEKSYIYQCTDLASKEVDGVDKVFRYDGDVKNIMRFRLEVFSLLNIQEKAIYLDTDMLVINKFDIDITHCDAILCKRSFDLDNLFNTSFRGMDLSEYKNMTLGDVYPFLGCFTVTKSSDFWKEAFNIQKSLDKKFHYWYGDQEALKIIKAKNILNIDTVQESIFACLPEKIDELNLPNIIHFKGAARKIFMLDVSAQMGLI